MPTQEPPGRRRHVLWLRNASSQPRRVRGGNVPGRRNSSLPHRPPGASPAEAPGAGRLRGGAWRHRVRSLGPARACTPERLLGRRRPVGRPAPGPRRLQPQPRPLGQAFNSALTSLVVFASFDTRPCRFPVTLNSVSPLTLPACLSVGQPLVTASVICFFLLEVPRGRQVTPRRVLPAAGAGLCSCLPGAVLSGRSHPLPPSSVPGLPSPGASRPRKPRPHPPA